MRGKHSLKSILARGREYWDRPQTLPHVRRNFEKVINCRTSALGAELFASPNEEKLVYHTCKSRICPSCGHRATLLWQREQWAALPDIPYAAVVFTMPNHLWPIFQKNRHLLHDLPVIASATIEQWARAEYGVRLSIVVVPHTFGRRINFNPHLHILVSRGGLQEASARWIAALEFNKSKLMRIWRYAVVSYLREALKARLLETALGSDALKRLLTTQYERRWNIFVDRFTSKLHFLRYAGRYVRHPPIAEHRFVRLSDRDVEFLTKDLKQKQTVVTRQSIEEFVSTLAEHVPDFYRHGMRYFGLLAPRSKRITAAALFTLLGQARRSRPRRLSWRHSIEKDFGIDPLLDSKGQPMRWVRRIAPGVQ